MHRSTERIIDTLTVGLDVARSVVDDYLIVVGELVASPLTLVRALRTLREAVDYHKIPTVRKMDFFFGVPRNPINGGYPAFRNDRVGPGVIVRL